MVTLHLNVYTFSLMLFPKLCGTWSLNICLNYANSVFLYKLDECKHLPTSSEKMKLSVEKWRLLSPKECAMWNEKAKDVAKFDVTQLSEKQRKHQILKVKKQLVSQVLVIFRFLGIAIHRKMLSIV